jgi:hypothetical protein
MTLSGVAFGAGTDADNDALAQIAELKAELAELKATEGDNWLTEQRATEIRGIVQDVLADADTRASLQSSGATAGWDNGFFLASADGNFRLNIDGQVQVRWAWNHRKDPNSVFGPGGTEENNWGFELARTKLFFSGHVVDPSWQYMVSMAFSGTSGVNGFANLQNAYVNKDFGNGFSLRVGQFRAPYMRELNVSSANQLAVERSLLSNYFGQTDYSQGAMISYAADAFAVHVMYSDGINQSAANVGAGWSNPIPSSQNSAFTGRTTDYAFAARGEFKAAGTWSQFDDMTSWKGEDFGLLIGAAMIWEKANSANAGLFTGDEARVFGLTADVSADFGGANLFGSFVYRHVSDANTNAGAGNEDSVSQWGFMVQGGFFITDEIEIFARYEYGQAKTDVNNAPFAADRLNALTFGVNWYLAKETVKWTTDFTVGFNPIIAFADAQANILEDNTTQKESGQFAIRTQLQLLF